MRIVQIVPTLEQEASGPSYSVPSLAGVLASRGHGVHLMSVGGQAVSIESSIIQTRYSKDFNRIPVVRAMWMSRGLNTALRAEAFRADVVHSHGLWVMPNIYPGWAAARAGRPHIISPRGTLGAVPLTYSRFRKLVFWKTFQGSVARRANCFHATSEQEYTEIRKFGLKQPVIVIPNGVHLPRGELSEMRARGIRRILYLGRIHQKKGIEFLLAAWAELSKRFNDWELRIVGPGHEKYVDELRRFASELGAPRVTFAGAKYGQEKMREYEEANLFVLPSLNENFGMTVAEAMAHGLPVIATTGTPWRGLQTEQCGWWVTPDARGVSGALNDALGMNWQELQQMGKRGRAWVARDYSWERVGSEMEAAYKWVLGGAEMPTSIRLS
jgi:glycosyltransferase involved in cell wall biosynthesis